MIGRFVLLLRVLLAAFWLFTFAGFATLFLLLAPRENRDDDDPDIPLAA